MDTDQPVGCQAPHCIRDAGTHVAALPHEAGVAETAHQLCPRLCGAAEVPTDLDRLAREAIAGQRRQHEVKRIRGRPAVLGRIRERTDGVEHLYDRTGPAVRHDQRQCILVWGSHVEKVDFHTIDLGSELGQRVQPRLDPTKVVLVRPVATDLLCHGQLHAL